MDSGRVSGGAMNSSQPVIAAASKDRGQPAVRDERIRLSNSDARNSKSRTNRCRLQSSRLMAPSIGSIWGSIPHSRRKRTSPGVSIGLVANVGHAAPEHLWQNLWPD